MAVMGMLNVDYYEDELDDDCFPLTQLLELDDNDRLHLQTKAFSSDGATGITFCVHLLSAAA